MNGLYQNLIKPLYLDIQKFVLDTLFPITCVSCDKEGKFICDFCRATLKRADGQQCIVCHKSSLAGLTHAGCHSPHKPEGLISVFDYHDVKISKAIIHGKYYFLPGVYRELATIAAEHIKRDYPHLLANDPVLTPIPLSKTRLRWRGFNQSEVFCTALGNILDIPVADTLMRTRHTKTQKDLKREERIQNMQDAFVLNAHSKSKILNANFILFDDVTTTGSTLLEAAKVLKRNGAKSIWCLTIARD